MNKTGIFYEIYEDGSIARKSRVTVEADGSGYTIKGGDTWFGGSDAYDIDRLRQENRLVFDDDDYEIRWVRGKRERVPKEGFYQMKLF